MVLNDEKTSLIILIINEKIMMKKIITGKN